MILPVKYFVKPPDGVTAFAFNDDAGTPHVATFRDGRPAWVNEAVAIALSRHGGEILKTGSGSIADADADGVEDSPAIPPETAPDDAGDTPGGNKGGRKKKGR